MPKRNYVSDNTKVDELGRVILPKKLRNDLHIYPGDNLSIELAEDIILVSKQNKYCVFCGSEKNLIKFRYKHICLDCIDEIKFDTSLKF